MTGLFLDPFEKSPQMFILVQKCGLFLPVLGLAMVIISDSPDILWICYDRGVIASTVFATSTIISKFQIFLIFYGSAITQVSSLQQFLVYLRLSLLLQLLNNHKICAHSSKEQTLSKILQAKAPTFSAPVNCVRITSEIMNQSSVNGALK